MVSNRSAVFCAFWLSVILVVAGTATAAGENIALNKPYGFSTPPNYSYCTDPGDTTQLTDGQYSDDGNFRLDIRTVGWSGSGAVSITIDLGQVEPIGGLSFRGSADGGGGFPAFIHIWVRDETGLYTYGGELISSSAVNGLPVNSSDSREKPTGAHQFVANNLFLRGRYVNFTAYRAGGYLWTDELQVFRGDFNPNDVTPSDIFVGFGYYGQWAQDHRHDPIARIRMLYDLQELENHPFANQFTSQVDSLRQQVLGMDLLAGLDMELGMPYIPLHGEIWELNGQMNLAAGSSEFSIAPGELYQPLHPFDTFTPDNSTHQVDLIGNERRSAAINVSNFSNQTNTAQVELTWDGAGFPDGDVDLRSVRFTEAQERFIVGTALAPATQTAPNVWQVQLPAGVTTQLWLTFNSKNAASGQYSAQLSVTPTASSPHTLPLLVEVHRSRMGDVPALDSFAWDYAHIPPQYSITTENNHEAALALLKEHQMKSHWMSAMSFMSDPGQRNPDGTYSTPPQFDGLNDWLADLDNMTEPTKRYYIYAGVDTAVYPLIKGGLVEGTPEYNTAVTSFFQAIAGEIDARGLPRSSFVFHVADEPPGLPGEEANATYYATVAKAAVPEFLFSTDPLYATTQEVNEDLMQACDIIIPHLTKILNNSSLLDYYQSLASSHGKELGTYWCTDGGLQRGPIAYFRRMAWEAQRLELEGIGVWNVMAASQENTWDDFSAGPSYEMIFATPDNVTPTKMLTAWRDGVQDYEYFKLIEQLADAVELLGTAPSLVAWARNLLDSTVTDGLNSINSSTSWLRSSDNGALDRGRLDLLEAIDLLTAQVDPQTCSDVHLQGYGIPGDLNEDCHINMADLSMFAGNWLRCNHPNDPICETPWK